MEKIRIVTTQPLYENYVSKFNYDLIQNQKAKIYRPSLTIGSCMYFDCDFVTDNQSYALNCAHTIRTSRVQKIEETADKLVVYTLNTVYTFIPFEEEENNDEA